MKQTKKVISIYTDRLHYHRKNRIACITDDLNQYLTSKWRNWFENDILETNEKNKHTKQSNPKKDAVYGSLRSCYRRTLRRLDSDLYAQARITRLDELFRVFENEMKVEIQRAKLRGVDEELIELLKKEFNKVERQAQFWNVRFLRKLGL